jgi:hypothetical protein
VIAHAHGGYLDKQIDLGLLAQRAPDTFVLRAANAPAVAARRFMSPVEQRISDSSWFQNRYHLERIWPYHDAYVYALYVAR